MKRTATLALALTVVLTACGSSDKSTTTQSDGTSTSSSSTSSTTGAVAAANAFLETLSSNQRSEVVFDFADDQKTTSWSNLPANLSPRKGISFGDMSDKQTKAGLALMKTVLSDQGYQELEDNLDADDYLGDHGSGSAPGGTPPSGSGSAPSGGPPGGGGDDYGRENYYFTFYGEPSASKEWMLQWTGHHLTFNIAYKGDTEVSFGPEFAGSEPMTFKKDGTTIVPNRLEAAGFEGVIGALTPAQKKEAENSESFDDLLLGAGNDGPFPDTPEGITVSDLSQKAQDEVEATIRAYIGDVAGGDEKVADYVEDFEKTGFTYAGSENTEDLSFYARIDGPKVWIEFSTQRAIVVSGNHYHSIYREQGSDYGE